MKMRIFVYCLVSISPLFIFAAEENKADDQKKPAVSVMQHFSVVASVKSKNAPRSGIGINLTNEGWKGSDGRFNSPGAQRQTSLRKRSTENVLPADFKEQLAAHMISGGQKPDK